MGAEIASKYSDDTGSGDTIYECLSFEYCDPMDTDFAGHQDQIGGAYFQYLRQGIRCR
jgi:hypothetical protein